MTRESIVVGGRRYLLGSDAAYTRTDSGVTTKILVEDGLQYVTVMLPLRLTASRAISCTGESVLPASKGAYAGVRAAMRDARMRLRRVRTAASSFVRSLQRTLKHADALDGFLRDELNPSITKRPSPQTVTSRVRRKRTPND